MRAIQAQSLLYEAMRIYDVSVPLSANTPTYPGDPGIDVRSWLTLASGDAANVSQMSFGLHSGTHVDAPAHFIEGAAKVESLSLQKLIGVAEVIQVPTDVCVIDERFVSANLPDNCERILFKTRNSAFWENPGNEFREDYTFIDGPAANRLAAAGVKLVGIDYLSVEKFQSETFETHHALLSREIVILEGLDLRQVPAGKYELICLPLKITDGAGDGAPARVVLRTLD